MQSAPDLTPTIHLWKVRIMLLSAGGAEPLWVMWAPSVPAEGEAICLPRTIDEPELDINGRRQRDYVVSHRLWFLAVGHEPDLSYGVDVYVTPRA